MSQGSFKYVYGPVPSRRLGRSLGVDLVPFKTCSYDCIYCQLGRTANKTTDRREYVPVDAVLDELRVKLRTEANPDFIGLAGSGEPTLHARLGDIVAGIKALTDVPVAVLTNGSLLWRSEICAGLAEADLVLPSLDAGTPETFERVNRPHPNISFERMVDGLSTFSSGFKGKVWLEVFVLAGLTDGREAVGRIATIAKKLRVDRLQLNTVSRPPAEICALTVSPDALEHLPELFAGPCEIIAESAAPLRPASDECPDLDDDIVALVSRRPCTIEGIAAGLAVAPNEVLKHLGALCSSGTVRAERREDTVFYETTRSR